MPPLPSDAHTPDPVWPAAAVWHCCRPFNTDCRRRKQLLTSLLTSSACAGAAASLARLLVSAPYFCSADRSTQQPDCSWLAGLGGWDSFRGSIPADLICYEGVLAEGPSSNATQRHVDLAISGLSDVNPMDQETTPPLRCLHLSPHKSHCPCSAFDCFPGAAPLSQGKQVPISASAAVLACHRGLAPPARRSSLMP